MRSFLAGCAVALAVFAGVAELAVRLAAPSSLALRRLLYMPGDRPNLDGIATLDELLAVAPFPLPPLLVWGSYRLNAHGLCTPEYQRDKAPGTFRIVAIGDSFTMDSGLVPQHQVWHRVVAAALQSQRAQPVEDINLGLPAIGPRFAAKMFAVEGATLQPDLVLFGLFLGNDLTDENWQRGSGLMRYSQAWRAARHFRQAVADRRQLAVTQQFGPAAEPLAPGAQGGVEVPGLEYDPNRPFLTEANFLRVESETAQLFRRSRRSELAPWIEDVGTVVEEVRARSTAIGARLIVVVFPARLQVAEWERPATLEAAGIAADDFDPDGVGTAAVERLRQGGVEVVDPLPVFRAAGERPLYRARDVHLNADGNALTAQAVLAHLARWTISRRAERSSGLAR